MSKKNLIKLALCFAVCWATLPGAAQDASISIESVPRGHPRLILTEERLAALKADARDDKVLGRYVTDVLKQADDALDAPALEHKLSGPRLLGVSRECLRRVYALGFAWRWTGDSRFADAVIDNLLTVAKFPDWNPSHFLDVAEMSHAVAIGYDWTYEYMDTAARQSVRTALIKHGLEPGMNAYDNDKPWWLTSEYNWNQVCNGGLTIAALAVAETDPEFAERIVPAAVSNLKLALATYAPDGVWPEGPSYWNYATRYTAYMIGALQTCFGGDFGLTELPGMAETAYFPIHCTGPTGLYFNFADASERASRKPMHTMFWLANVYENSDFAAAEHALLEENTADALHVVWYPGKPADYEWTLARDRYFQGAVDVVTMRSAWNDPMALYLAAKGGFNQVNHGQLDLGTFVFDALGVRWARDLGNDNYNLPGYWSKGEGGKRWTYYRLNAYSHNVTLVCGKDQPATGTAEITGMTASDAETLAAIDTTNAYGDGVVHAEREVALEAGRSRARIADRIQLTKPCTVRWGMTTGADVVIEDGRRALLTLDGHRLSAELTPESQGRFLLESAEQEPPQARNKGVKRLIAEVADGEGVVFIEVTLTPME